MELLILNFFLISLGIGLFGLSYSLFRKSKEETESLKIYGAFAYGGVVLFVLGIEQIIGYYVSFHWWHGVIMWIILEIAVYCLIRPGFRKSNQDGLKKRKILGILFNVVIFLSVILLMCNLLGLKFFYMQDGIAWLGFALGNIGEIWLSDIARKTKYIFVAFYIIAGVLIILCFVRDYHRIQKAHTFAITETSGTALKKEQIRQYSK